MTHEPECRAVTFADPPEANQCSDCYIARAAYQRGREDAVKAMSQHLHYTELMILEACCHEAGRGVTDKVANATLSDKPCTGSCLLKGHFDAQCRHTPTPREGK